MKNIADVIWIIGQLIWSVVMICVYAIMGKKGRDRWADLVDDEDNGWLH